MSLTAQMGVSDLSSSAPLVEMKHIYKQFGGIHAVEDVSIDLNPGEIVGILGHNGAGKSCLMRMLSGAMSRTSGEIFVDGKKAEINTPIEARELGIETIYQTLALADHLDAPANLFLGRELKTQLGTLDKKRMEEEARTVLQRLNPNFQNITDIVRNMSGGQRQVIAIARAIYFNARILIMDEPTAALGPSETQMVKDLMRQLRNEGIGIFLISHDIHDVYELCDRVMVMKNGVNVGMHPIDEVTQDDILSLIILSRLPESWQPRNLAVQ
jgi:D-xylose transport system ATP-binding protein